MAKETLNIGTVANDNTGDTLRNAASKINGNFDQLFSTVSVQTVTGDTLATNEDGVFICDATLGSIIITLPTAVDNSGKNFFVKQISANNAVTIKGSATETIDGNNEKVIAGFFGNLNAYVSVISNGVQWYVTGVGQ